MKRSKAQITRLRDTLVIAKDGVECMVSDQPMSSAYETSCNEALTHLTGLIDELNSRLDEESNKV